MAALRHHLTTCKGNNPVAQAVWTLCRVALHNKPTVDQEDVKGALEDFIPPSYPTEIDLQNIVAVLECTSKSPNNGATPIAKN